MKKKLIKFGIGGLIGGLALIGLSLAVSVIWADTTGLSVISSNFTALRIAFIIGAAMFVVSAICFIAAAMAKD